jgi:hypothetical protein
VLAKRKAIREQLITDLSRRESYVALLMHYIRTTFYTDRPGCFAIIIDNVDREPSLTQQQVKMVMKPFAKASGVRTVINTRQTTYYQQFDDGVSDPMDRVPFCGRPPATVVLRRLDNLLAHPEGATRHCARAIVPDLLVGIQRVRMELERDGRLHQLFSALCGRSVRKGLLLAQRLIDNSVYDLVRERDFNTSDMERALLVGTAETFVGDPSNIVENVFEVMGHRKGSHFIKIRILRALRHAGDAGLKVNGLLDLMNRFEYDLPLTCSAINDLKREQKRLLWSDARKGEFEDETVLVSHGQSQLTISSIGEGYDELLPCSLSYVQEVMLDTAIEPADFGRGWDYGSLEDRFMLVLRFLRLLHEEDAREMRICMANAGPHEYESWFGRREIVSKDIIVGVRASVGAILGKIHSRGTRHDFDSFREEQLQAYDDLYLRAENVERQIFA